MQTVARQERDDEFPEDIPTTKELPSGRWIIAVDRGARKLEAAIDAIEAGTDPADLLDVLKEAHRLVNGRAT